MRVLITTNSKHGLCLESVNNMLITTFVNNELITLPTLHIRLCASEVVPWQLEVRGFEQKRDTPRFLLAASVTPCDLHAQVPQQVQQAAVRREHCNGRDSTAAISLKENHQRSQHAGPGQQFDDASVSR